MEKLYDVDSYINEFEAVVLSCTEVENGFSVLLSETAFFPTAGGQTCDGGVLDGQKVIKVYIENNEVFHIVKEPIAAGKTVNCRINWEERFRKMQHHSAEHIVSGIAFSEFKANNVGFHLSDDGVTIDYDREFSETEILELERLANSAVQKNLEISAVYPSEEELKSLNYRSKLDLTENVRIVTIPGIDICACCAPHIKRTGEIGLIKLTEAMRHRSGMRFRMICGMDALYDYEEKKISAEKISKLLSAKQNETVAAVEKIFKENGSLRQEISRMKNEAMLKLAEQMPQTSGNLAVFLETADKSAMRFFANAAKDKISGILAVLTADEKGGFNYILTSKTVNLPAVSKEINNALSGRGGGREDIEGTFGASRQEIEKYFSGN